MGIARFNFRSEELGRCVDVTIVMPTDLYSYKKPEKPVVGMAPVAQYEEGMRFQTVYLIHGGGDDDSLTYRYTNAERYAQQNNVMLVTPNIVNSFGVDTEYQVHYQSFIAKELPVIIQSLFASSAKREDNFIVGYAMGGNVALGTAIQYPELYRMCIDLSGGIGQTLATKTLESELDGEHFRTNFPLYNATFGASSGIEGSRFDLYSIAQKNLQEKLTLPDYLICCGEKEFIRSRVEDDVRILQELGYPVRYYMHSGYDHNFEYWDMCLKCALDEWLPLKRFETIS